MILKNINVSELRGYAKNSRKHSKEQIQRIANSIEEFGFTNPILIDKKNTIIAGHARFDAAIVLGLDSVPTIELSELTETQIKAYVIADNKLAELSEWNDEILKAELDELKLESFDLSIIGFDDSDIAVASEEDDYEIPDEIKTDIVAGDLFEIGEHRLLCGDSTDSDQVEKLMNGEKADMAHNDPPYGMKKEKEGVLNDNLNYNDLLNFNREWIALQFMYLKENGSWYCWGIDEPLMDIYAEILKPYIAEQKATFRNLITWDKGNGQGQNSDNTRSYAIADEKCLFAMMGVQGFNNNQDNYFDKWEPIRIYLEQEIKKLNESDGKIAAALGYKDGRTVNHWWSKSQWTFPTKENYEALREYGKTKNIDIFKKEYEELKKEYEELKKEYEELKKEYYSTRAYFNNVHDNFNNVWKFERHLRNGSEGGHATPKPILLCERTIKSSCPENGLVLDMFLGSGSTMVAAHQLKRKCYGMELDPKYCQVIIDRMKKLDEKIIIKRNGVIYDSKKT